MADLPPPPGDFPPPSGFPAPPPPQPAPPQQPPTAPPPTWQTPAPPPQAPLPPPPAGYYSQQAGYGYAAGGGGPAPQPLGGLATALTILLVLAAIAELIAAAAFFNRAAVLDTNFDFQDLSDADDAVGGAFLFVILAFLACGILWMIWQYRHAKNAVALGQQGGLGPGWAIGGWFVPLGNFVLPQLQLTQAAKASDPDAPPGAGRVPPIVMIWWGLFVLQAIVGAASGRFGANDDFDSFDSIDDFQSADRIAGVGSLIAAFAAVVALLVVRSLSARQQRAVDARSGQQQF